MIDPSARNQITGTVREILGCILGGAEFPGSSELHMQAASVTVTGGPITMLELHAEKTAPVSAFTDGPIPVSAVALDAEDGEIGELLVWVDAGYLSALEFAWWTDDPPDSLPSRYHIRKER